jgi:hypothetical protein
MSWRGARFAFHACIATTVAAVVAMIAALVIDFHEPQNLDVVWPAVLVIVVFGALARAQLSERTRLPELPRAQARPHTGSRYSR